MDLYHNYLSPFSWRYASQDMRSLWSENRKRTIWRKIWIALAKTQSRYGLVSEDQIVELENNATNIDMETAINLESKIHHDLMAELKTFAAQCPKAGGILHLGATSMDIEDNADALRIRVGLDIILKSLIETLTLLSSLIEKYNDLPVMGYTHIQPAEPTTLGYRLSVYAQDVLEDFFVLKQIRTETRGKGFKGAVGTAAAYADLIGPENFDAFENELSQVLDLPFFPVSTQTYPRKQDYKLISALAGLGASLHKFALDLRILQSPSFGEVSEPFSKNQIGSSAMPFKRNPINAEKIDSLARQLSVLPQIAWQNAANSILERTLDDSANRRTILPESFLIVDELLAVTNRILSQIFINEKAIMQNFERYAPFAAIERLMMAAVKNGADRQAIHEILRKHALDAWNEIQNGKENPLKELIMNDPDLTQWVSRTNFDLLFNVQTYIGIAQKKAFVIINKIKNLLIEY